MGNKTKLKKKKITAAKMLRKTFDFVNDAAEGALATNEMLKTLDSSTTEAKLNLSQYNFAVELVSKLLIIKGLLKTADLGKYETYAIKQILKSYLGPKTPIKTN